MNGDREPLDADELNGASSQPRQDDQPEIEDHTYSRRIGPEVLAQAFTSQTPIVNINKMDLMFRLNEPMPGFFESIIPKKIKPPSAAELLKNVVIFLKSLYRKQSSKSLCFEQSDKISGIRSSRNDPLESQVSSVIGELVGAEKKLFFCQSSLFLASLYFQFCPIYNWGIGHCELPLLPLEMIL